MKYNKVLDENKTSSQGQHNGAVCFRRRLVQKNVRSYENWSKSM